MTLPPQQVASVRWAAVFPWLILVRAARVALMMRVIFLALIGVAATSGGWLLVESSPLGDRALGELQAEPQTRTSPPRSLALPAPGEPETVVIRSSYAPGPLVGAWRWLIQPFTHMPCAAGWRSQLALLLAGIWSLGVWALFGGAIARIAGVYLACGETIGPFAALRASARRWRPAVGALLLVALAIALLALTLVLAGLLLRSDLMALLLGFAWIIALCGGAATAILAIGLGFGWPLMWSTVAVQRTDSFDAISRGFAYLYQRPLHLLFYFTAASLLGSLAQFAVDFGVRTTTAATEVAVGIGAGEGRLRDLGWDGNGVSHGLSEVGEFGATAIQFWTNAIRAAARYFPLAYFWPATTAIYLLLRRDIDGAEMTEIEFDEGEATPGLPRLTPDTATGVPQVERSTDGATP